MPKNKGKFGKGKPAIAAEPDEFLTGMDRLVRSLRPHAVRIMVLVGAATAVLVGYAVYHWYGARQAKRATSLYAEAVRLSMLPIKDEPVEPPEGTDPDRVMSFKSEKERAEAALKKIETLRSTYGGTGVAAESRLLQADLLSQLGRYDKAAKLYRAYAGGEEPEELRLTAREGIGYALEEKALAAKDPKARQAGLESALEAFEKMQPAGDGPRRDQALYHQGRVLAELGRRDKALKTYKEVLSMPNTRLREDVETRVAALKAGP